MNRLLAVAALWSLLSGGAGGTARAAPAAALDPGAYDRAFWDRWSDGLAEVSTYALHRTRYGEPRDGVVVAIVVSEPWSKKKMVKDDAAAGADRLPVLKLHTTTSFQTGVYDYHLATSAFVNLEPLNGMRAGSVIKVAFSAQEWCGQVYHEYVDDGRASSELVRSYFANESMSRSVARESGPLLVEDALLLWARGLAGPQLPPRSLAEKPVGATFQPSLERSRLEHKPVERSPAIVTRMVSAKDAGRGPDAMAVVVEVAGEEVVADNWRVALGNVRVIDIVVERGGARRVLSVADNDGTTLQLVKSQRLPYWQQNHVADEPLRATLGLTALPSLPVSSLKEP